jgi:energy-coupling factor transport system permease protein
MLLLTIVFQFVGSAIAGSLTLESLPENLHLTIVLLLRVTVMVCCMAWFYYTTNVLDLSRIFEKFLGAIPGARAFARDASTTVAIALRFVPTVMEEAGELRLAQRFRGARFDGGLRARIRGWSSVLIPLFLNTVDRADKLALALETRGYGLCEHPSSYRQSAWKHVDTVLVISMTATIIALVLLDRLL